jgi:hypothetical protein
MGAYDSKMKQFKTSLRRIKSLNYKVKVTRKAEGLSLNGIYVLPVLIKTWNERNI